MKLPCPFSLAWLICLAISCQPILGAELPVRDGLALWLDAQSLDGPSGPPAEGVPVATWRDGSGSGRDVVQSDPAFRPVYHGASTSQTGAVRFDGIDDRLARASMGAKFKEITLFVVAAPHSNAGGFRALVSMNGKGRNDYITGLNVDLSGGGEMRFRTLNVEGAGAVGQQNFLTKGFRFGTFHVLALQSGDSAGAPTLKLFVDGTEHGRRDRAPGEIVADELRVGCRHYSNSADPTFDSGFFHGDVAEVLIYDRAITADERKQVEAYLAAKHADLLKVAGLPEETPLRMLVPGFVVSELPVELTNINDLAYDPKGVLFALGYDGRIHRLFDRDGDGIEDTAMPYWTEPTLKGSLAMSLAPEGIYVASIGKISLIRDTNGDGRADREEIVVSDWEKPDNYSGGVDALSVLRTADGTLYFTLGCYDFTNAYRIRDGKSHYKIGSERGTVIRVSADRKKREIVATGVRFGMSLAQNAAGDLFVTDQEGETWLPNGNPLDELLHVQPKRHYGFPPRHPRHLPDVVDELAVVGFGPQHQSTCGLVFNEPAPGGKIFGPAHWRGNALVTGYSRGKLWRVELVKTLSGYIGRERLIGAANILTLDSAIDPAGNLVVACHSGAPDWGSGPQGEGRLFKIRYAQPEMPQPIVAWPAGPAEVRVAFDRPLGNSIVDAVAAHSIEYGEHVRPGDRFERIRPGYAVVDQQQRAFRAPLSVRSAKLIDGGRTLSLETDAHRMAAHHAIALAGLGSPSAGSKSLKLLETVDIGYDLNGARALWVGDGDAAVRKSPTQKSWSGWLPSLDLDVSRATLRGTADGERLNEALRSPGKMKLTTHLLPPGEEMTLRVTASVPLDVALGAEPFLRELSSQGVQTATQRVKPGGKRAALTIEWLTRAARDAPSVHVSYRTAGDPSWRPLRFDQQRLPWAPDETPPAARSTSLPPELAGGDRGRGEALFFGQKARCSACHMMAGRGDRVGPDLSNLAFRDARSVHRDIVNPSAAIHPDYVSYSLRLIDGTTLAGIVRAESGDRWRVTDTNAKVTIVPAVDVDEIQASRTSIMPADLEKSISPAEINDLLAFVLAPPTEPKPPGVEPPLLRTREEVDKALAAAKDEDKPPADAEKLRPLNIVLVWGNKDHGPGEHDYPRWQAEWSKLLAKGAKVSVRAEKSWPTPAQWQAADVVVFYHMDQGYTPERYKEIDAFQGRGGGLVLLHSAVIPKDEPEKFADRFGLAWQWRKTKFRHGPLTLKTSADHAITRGLPKELRLIDETYWPMIGDQKRITILATAEEESRAEPMLWTYEKKEGRVFCSILGHYYTTFDDPFFRLVLLRGIAWAAGQPTERLVPLAKDGVRFKE